MNEKIKKINEKLNRNVAYAWYEGRGEWCLRFANTDKLITSCKNFTEFKSEVEELLETGVPQGNSIFIIKKEVLNNEQNKRAQAQKNTNSRGVS